MNRLFVLFLISIFLVTNLLSQETFLIKEHEEGSLDDIKPLSSGASPIWAFKGEVWYRSNLNAMKILDKGDDYHIEGECITLRSKFYFISELKNSVNSSFDSSLYEYDPVTDILRPLLSSCKDLGALSSMYGGLYVGILNDSLYGNAYLRIEPEVNEISKSFEFYNSETVPVYDAIHYELNYYAIYRGVDGKDYLSRWTNWANSFEQLLCLGASSVDNELSKTNLTGVGGQVFFWHTLDGANYRLIVSDGTSDGTVILKDNFKENLRHKFINKRYRDIGVFSDRIYFNGAEEGDDVGNLWTSDGSIEGTFKMFFEEQNELMPSFFTSRQAGLESEFYFSGRLYNGDSNFGLFKIDESLNMELVFSESLSEDLVSSGININENNFQFFYPRNTNLGDGEIFSISASFEDLQQVTNLSNEQGVIGWYNAEISSLISGMSFYLETENSVKAYYFKPFTSSLSEELFENILVYPNPFYDKLFFSQKIDLLNIYNYAGVKVKGPIYDVLGGVNLGELAEGVYLLEMNNGNSKTFKKVIK